MSGGSADNVFFHLTYEGAVNVTELTDPYVRASTEAQIAHFGQTPTQLFTEPHPERLTQEEALMHAWDAAIASALLARRHSAKRSLVRSPHASAITSLHFSRSRFELLTVDASGIAASALYRPDVGSGELPCYVAFR